MTPIDGTEAILDRAAGLLHRDLGLRPDPAMLGRLRRSLRDEAAARQQQPDGFHAARAALNRCRPSEDVAALGGYRIEELVALLDSRQEEPCQR